MRAESVTPTLQEQARALGDPTRHAIFRYLADAGTPVDVAELTEHFGLNHNAIRQHLAKLVHAGLVTEGRAAEQRAWTPAAQLRDSSERGEPLGRDRTL